MKALLRKKSHSREPQPAPPPPPSLPTQGSSSSSLDAPPPLYARFARTGSASNSTDDIAGGGRPSVSGPMPLASKASRAPIQAQRDKALPVPAPVQEQAPRMGRSTSSGIRNGNGNGYAREINGAGRDIGPGGGLPSPPTSPALAPATVVRPMSSVLDDPFAAPRIATPPAMPRDPEMDGLGGRSSKRDSIGSYTQQQPIQPTTPRRSSKLVKRAPSSAHIPQSSTRAPHSPPPSFARGPHGVLTPPQSIDGHASRSFDSGPRSIDGQGPRSIDGHGPRSIDGHGSRSIDSHATHRLPHPPPTQSHQYQTKRLSKQPSTRSVHSGGPVPLYSNTYDEKFDPASVVSPAPSNASLPQQQQPAQRQQRQASGMVSGSAGGQAPAPSVKPGQIFPTRRGPLIFGAQDTGAAPRSTPAAGPPPALTNGDGNGSLAPGFTAQPQPQPQQHRPRGPQGNGPPPVTQNQGPVQRSASQQLPIGDPQRINGPPRSSSVSISQSTSGSGSGPVSYVRGPDGVLRRVQQQAASMSTPGQNERVLSPPPGSERVLSPPPTSSSSRGLSPAPESLRAVPSRALSPSPAPTARASPAATARALSPPPESAKVPPARQRAISEARQRAESSARAKEEARVRKEEEARQRAESSARAREEDAQARASRPRKESDARPRHEGRQPTDSSLDSSSSKSRRRGKSDATQDEGDRERKWTDSGTYDAYSPYDAALTFASASRPSTATTSSSRPGTATSASTSRPTTGTGTGRATSPPVSTLAPTSMYADGLVASPIDAFAPSSSPMGHSPIPHSPLPHSRSPLPQQPSRSPQPPSRSPQPQPQTPSSPKQRRASPVQHRQRPISPDQMRYGSPEKEKPRNDYHYPSSHHKSRAMDDSFESEGDRDFEPVGMDEERRASRALLAENFRASRALLSEERVQLQAQVVEGKRSPDDAKSVREAREGRRMSRIGGIAEKRVSYIERPVTPSRENGSGQAQHQHSPTSPSRIRARAAAGALEPVRQSVVEDSLEETYYPILRHLGEPDLLDGLLRYLTFAEWLALWTCSRASMKALNEAPYLRELILERWLSPVGYTRWPLPTSGPGATIAQSKTKDPLPLTLKELAAYMRGVSAPPQANVLLAQEALRGQAPAEAVRAAKKSTRAYNRVVLRLRAQAELVPTDRERVGRRERSEGGHGPPPSWSAGGRAAGGRSLSRAPSPTNSAWGGHSTSGHGRRPSQGGSTPPQVPVVNTTNALYRPRRAPLLRVFVPANGDWLDDQGVLEAEGELRKAGIAQFLRAGDVVWDTALGDEGNTGRMLWDGRYLIDLDYTYTPLGDVPGSLPSLAFAPSFWHRVVRTAGDRGPVVHVDVKPWAEEIAGNLQLLQDRVRTETPQGNYHTVVRWVHRSSFTIRNSHAPHAPTLILPGRVNAPIDQGWYGTVVLEAEGTNEGLADLQQRCRGGFPPNAAPGHALRRGEREFRVWRILRERSRPGEIWIRAVSYKERLLP